MAIFQLGDRVWSRAPLFFHGTILGAFMDEGQTYYVIKTDGGNLLHCKAEDLRRPPNHVPTAKSSGLA